MLIDSESPITISIKAHAEKMFGKHFRLRPLEKEDKYVDCSSNKVESLGAVIGRVEAGAKKLDKERASIAESETRTVIGRDWLRGVGIKLKTEDGKCEINFINETLNKLFKEFKNLFSRQGRLECHELKAQFKGNCVPKQQKARRIPLQLQHSVKNEIEN